MGNKGGCRTNVFFYMAWKHRQKLTKTDSHERTTPS